MHDGFISPVQWYYWMNKENYALALFIARAGWVENIQTLTITPTGTENGKFILNLPNIPLAIVAIHEVGTNLQGVRLLKNSNAVEFLRQLPGSTVNPFGHSKEYRVIWDQDNDQYFINFFPEPSLSTQYMVSYIPAPKKLVQTVNDATKEALSVTYPLGWEERVVLGMAREALDKEESDTVRIEKKLKDMESRIEEFCWSRILSAVPTIRNSDQDERGWSDKGIYPPVLQYFWF